MAANYLMRKLRSLTNFWKHVTRISSASPLRYLSYIPAYLRGGKGDCPPPSVVLLAVNSDCNLRCRMCDVGRENGQGSTFYETSVPTGRPRLSYEQLTGIIDQLAAFKPFLAVNSLEPFLHPDLCRAAGYAVDRGLEVQLTSNGTMLAKRAKEIIESGAQRLMLSLDGTPRVHDSIRGMEGLFDKGLAGLREIQRLKTEGGLKHPKIQISVTVSSHNQADLAGMIDHLEGLEIEYLLVAHLNFVTAEMAEAHNAVTGPDFHVSPSSFTEEYEQVEPEILARELQEMKSRAARAGIPIIFQPVLDEAQLRTFYHRPAEFIERTRCFVPWSACQIRADGTIIPATRCFPYRLGDLNEESFATIWNGRRAKALRAVMRSRGVLPACSRCCNIF